MRLEYSYAPASNATPVVFDSTTIELKTWCNGSWHTLQTADSITFEMQQWIERKMQEDRDLEQLLATHPNIREAKQALDILVALAKQP